jgi:hypothetical protein
MKLTEEQQAAIGGIYSLGVTLLSIGIGIATTSTGLRTLALPFGVAAHPGRP